MNRLPANLLGRKEIPNETLDCLLRARLQFLQSIHCHRE
jgi:hypothetical protein